MSRASQIAHRSLSEERSFSFREELGDGHVVLTLNLQP